MPSSHTLISYYPTMAHVGRVGGAETGPFIQVAGLAACWILALRLGNIGLWRVAQKRLEVQGG